MTFQERDKVAVSSSFFRRAYEIEIFLWLFLISHSFIFRKIRSKYNLTQEVRNVFFCLTVFVFRYNSPSNRTKDLTKIFKT